MPVHLVRWSGPDLFERGVSGDGDEFRWSDRPLMQGELFEAARNLGMMAGLPWAALEDILTAPVERAT